MRCNITGATLNLSLVVLLKSDRKQKAAIAAALANGKITQIR